MQLLMTMQKNMTIDLKKQELKEKFTELIITLGTTHWLRCYYY